VGLPHSEIRGSKVALTSPQLIAECHVLLRLLVPRHPPNALKTLASLTTLISIGQRQPRPETNSPQTQPNQPIPNKGTHITARQTKTKSLGSHTAIAQTTRTPGNNPEPQQTKQQTAQNPCSLYSRSTMTKNDRWRRCRPVRNSRKPPCCRIAGRGADLRRSAGRAWWAREDLNFRPHAYQARALTS
jgi:hypothetical protein